MTAVADRTEFLRLLEMSKLIDADVLTAVQADTELPAEPGEMAEKLIQQGILTRFQTKQLLAGKYRGFVLGPYRLLDQIGQGGMGTVFLAQHATLKRKVALKVLSREHAEIQTSVDRFQREARAASALAHPNIVRVNHTGNAAGVHFLVMEYVDGATLEAVIDRKGPFTFEEAAQIAVQAAAGLHYAHEKGFVHRDVKPENLMLARGGAVKILDMGLTKSVTQKEDNLTGQIKTDVVLGTIDYLSPEQAIQGNIDARSDVYSLGATLFTLICGHSPYEGVPPKQKLMKHQFGEVPDLRTFRPDVPDALAEVVKKMMAKKPDDRPQSMVGVIEALAPWSGTDSLAVNVPSTVLRIPSREQSMTPTVTDAAARTRSDLPVEPDLAPVGTPPAAAPKHDIAPVVTIGKPPEQISGKSAVWIGLGVGAVIVGALVVATVFLS